MTPIAIGILDYGMANLRSVQKGFEQVGQAAEIVVSPEQVDACERFVLPGVGAFRDAVRVLRERSLDVAIRRHVARGRPFLGICLGLQMLFDVGEEDGEWQGLGVLRGRCVRFDVDARLGLKVPHMGWNALRIVRRSPLLQGVNDGAHVYFVHSYHVVPDDRGVISTTTDYGGDFVSSVWRENIMATQFHPEKSQQVGLRLLENFARG
jgi:glutamine amidotransferase